MSIMFQINENTFTGVFSNCDDTYYCNLTLPQYPKFVQGRLKTSFNLKNLLNRDIDFENHFKSLQSVDQFERYIRNVIDLNVVNNYKIRSSKFYTQLFKELEEIGVSSTIDDSLAHVTLNAMDSSGRNHIVIAYLPDEYPANPVMVKKHELPLGNSASLCSNPNFDGVSTLLQLFKQFTNLIEIFQPFWDMMEILDFSCKILEPLQALHSDCHRRIKLSEGCSALLNFNPYAPNITPCTELRGIEEEVAKFRHSLELNLINDAWDPEVDVHLNLLTLFDLDIFPMNESKTDECALIQPGECGICFEDRLEGQAANQRCDNARCNSQYHQICLLKYLCANSTTVRMRNAVLGQCPTCRESIGCSTMEWTHFE